MQTCYNCGEQVEDNVLICPSCGALVKRYGTPVRESDPEPEAEQPEPGAKSAVFRDRTGRLRLRTAVKVLMILGTAVSLYTALSFTCVLLVYNDQEFYLSVWQQIPQLSAMLDTMTLLMEAVRDHYVLFLLYPILLAAQAAAMIWFLCSKRKLAFRVAAAVTGLVFLVSLFFGSFLTAIVYGAAVLFSWTLLKKDWAQLPD